jgi:hypothetical protein
MTGTNSKAAALFVYKKGRAVGTLSSCGKVCDRRYLPTGYKVPGGYINAAN